MPLQIVVTVDEKGQLNVQGPLDNKIVMLGALELAKVAVIAHNADQRIVPASVVPANPFGN